MVTTYRSRTPLPALGMTSLVLGVIGLLLAFLPVLGIPLSICGIVFGVVGFFAALGVPGTYLRWAAAGLATSLLSLGINVAIANAPGREVTGVNVPPLWQSVPDRPAAPPPARPHFSPQRHEEHKDKT